MRKPADEKVFVETNTGHLRIELLLVLLVSPRAYRLPSQMGGRRKMWSLQAARNSFSAVVAAALDGRPQYVSRRGRTAVVVISAEDYARLAAASGTQRSFVAHLLDQPEGADPPRAQVEARDVAF